MELADYDSTHYDYEKYWQTRGYEDLVERKALGKLLSPTGGSLVDIGGGFGRHLKTYLGKYRQLTLLDYSQENLDRAQRYLKNENQGEVTLIRGDVYHLPFPDNTFDAGMMIRVMHHLEDPATALQEIYRIMKPRSVFILEFANKCHFKALISHGPIFCQDLAPYSQLTQGSGVFLNHHPQVIEKIVKNLGWKIEEKFSVSNFRSPLLKKILPKNVLVTLDDLLQKPLGYINFGPSIFLKLVKSPLGE